METRKGLRNRIKVKANEKQTSGKNKPRFQFDEWSALIIINIAASQFVYAKSFLRCVGFVFNVSLPPSNPPTIAIIANGKAHDGLKSPCIACPANPMNAVAAISVDAVPTAVRIGTPHANTISGTRKDPPETPAIPEAKPVKIVIGNATHKLTPYSSVPDRIWIMPKCLFPSKVRSSETGISMTAPAKSNIKANISFKEKPVNK